MLYNTYRPQKFSDVVGQKDTIENLIAQSVRDSFFGVYILCGQFGSGKTTTARIIAMAANCEHKDEFGNPCGECEVCRSIREGTAPDVQEVAAAVSTGVDKVREICDTIAYLPVAFRKKVYIIDEVQALSKAAFQAFLKMLEEPPEHAIFVLATTDVGAIPPTVRSRAATYYFRQITQTEIAEHLKKVSAKERLSVSEDACAVIAKYAQGSMRNALSLLDIAAQDGKSVTGEKVEKLLGVSTPDSIFSVIREVLSGNSGEIITKLNALAEGGADLGVLVSDMLSVVADLAVATVSLDSVKGTEHYLSLIRETVVYGSSVRFSAIADELFKVKQIMSKAPELSMLIVSLIRLSRREDVVTYKEMPGEDISTLRNTISALESRLRMLEESIAAGVVLSMQPKSDIVEQTESKEVDEPVQMVVAEETRDDGFYVDEESVPEEFYSVADAESQEEVNVSVSLEEEVVAEEATNEEVPESESLFGDEEEIDEGMRDYYAFLGIEMEPEKESAAAKNQRELEQDALYKAVMSCFDVKEENKEVVLRSDFPIAKKFCSLLLPAYENRGYAVTGIRIE